MPRLVNLFLKLPRQLSFLCFLPLILSYSHYLSSLLADSCLLLLTFLSHSFSLTSITFSSYLFFAFYFFIWTFFFFLILHIQESPPSLVPSVSVCPFFVSVLVSHTCCDNAFDLALLGLSEWYAVRSHTWRGTEVSVE